MANQRFRGKCPHCGKLTSESFSTSLVLDCFALTCHWCSKPYDLSSSQIIFEKGLQDQVDNPINTSSKIYFNDTPLAGMSYTPGMPITEGLINDSRPSSIFSGDDPVAPHFVDNDSSTLPPSEATNDPNSVAFYDPVPISVPDTTCQHEGEVYYSVEEDNYYCADCNQGMGNAYYKLAKRLEAKKKPKPAPRPKPKLGQRKVQRRHQ